MASLRPFEALRNDKIHLCFDSVADVRVFQASGNVIVFISHQWLSFSAPDDEEQTQFAAMKRAVSRLAEETPQRTFVWVDYCSIPQSIPCVQQLSINSLPAYVLVSDHLVICAPIATHVETGVECNL